MVKTFVVQVNPNLEFLNSILLTGKYNELTKPYIGYGLMTEAVNEYTLAIRSFFERHHKHPIYGFIESMIPKGFTFSRPVELMLSLGDGRDFTMQLTPSDLCVEYCGGLSNVHELLSRLKSFAEESGYFAFFEKAKAYYDPIVERVRREVQKYPFISMLEQAYGKEQNSYHYVLSSLMIGNYGIHFCDEDTGKVDLFSVFSTDSFSLSPAILFHEYSHPFINPLTEKYAGDVEKYQGAFEWLKNDKQPGFKSGYGDWMECVNEHFVRAMTIHLLRKCRLFDAAERMLKHDLYCGYRYIPLILDRYEYYDRNRNAYPDFESYYIELLKVFGDRV